MRIIIKSIEGNVLAEKELVRYAFADGQLNAILDSKVYEDLTLSQSSIYNVSIEDSGQVIAKTAGFLSYRYLALMQDKRNPDGSLVRDSEGKMMAERIIADNSLLFKIY